VIVMTSRFVLLSALALFLALPDLVHAQAPAPAYKTVEFDSPSVGRKMKYNIVLPAQYAESSERYPVLYLLHGYSSNYTAWARMGVPAYAKNYKVIVVMPDGGNSWYVNWAKSDEGQKNSWDDAITKDLIGHIDGTYRTIASRAGRAISGLSMGGYGGLMLGLKHPDMFCSIGTQSGAIAFAKQAADRIKNGQASARPTRPLSTQPRPEIGIEGFMTQVERSPKGKIFVTVEDCAAYDPFQLVLKTPVDKLPHICIDCGTEDGLLAPNQEFMKLLMEKKIPFTYAQSAGAHVGAYWAREVGEAMAIQYVMMQRHLAAEAKTPKAAAGN
jgi:S-formylglutathione hydrolase FrmB